MKIAFMPDTHFGEYDQETPPGPEEVADAMDHCIAEARLAEEVGFEGLWVPERHQRPETWWPNTTSLLAVIAANTKTVQIASTVIQPTFHHPIHLAESLAAVDNLSRGRFVFGAGVGYHQDYFKCFGVPFDKRGKRFEETMECIIGAWTQEEFDYRGEFFNYEGVKLSPKPFQRPRPPIWIGAFAPKAMERALDYEGWCLWFPPHVDILAPAVADMRQRAIDKGKTDFQITIGFEGWLGDEPNLREKHVHRWVREWSFYADNGLSPEAESKDMADQVESMFVCVGNKQKWIDRMSEMKERVDPDWLCIRTRNPKNGSEFYPTRSECLDVIEAFGEILNELR